FPLWHVFAALRGYRDIAATVASEPLRVASLAVSDRSGSLRVLLANLSPDPVSVRLTTIANASLRVLDARNIVGATQKPEEFWRRTPAPLASAVELGPHALAFIDSAAPARQLE
ncbi:MAG TPA: hypothetical protein DCE44_15280, partial [Verrucomicrobiales bacterium]|nr:hypothetical protein [Verrucomicrobiales bacterium]